MTVCKKELVQMKEDRLGEEQINNQGSLMKIIQYNKSSDIIVEFQDEYKYKIHTTYSNYKKGNVKNLYYPEIYNVAMIGSKYPSRINGIQTKEYKAWFQMIRRCFDKKYHNTHKTYEKVTCCKEWLLYENFYEWLHSQENFSKWLSNERWSLDKDIFIKANKIYSPDTCCLVPMSVNALFERKETQRGKYPIGVTRAKNGFQAQCSNPLNEDLKWIGSYETIENAFNAYKNKKEFYIKQVAQIEYDKGNISKKCYEAMMNYRVEITD